MRATQAVDEALIADVVREVLERLGTAPDGAARSGRPPGRPSATDLALPAARGDGRPAIDGRPTRVDTRSAAAGRHGVRPLHCQYGVFPDVDGAIAAATRAQGELAQGTVETRAAAVECIRAVLRRDKDELGRMELAETKIGKLPHKLEKLEIAAGVPGLEMLRTEATSGDHGLTVTEYAPYGVIGTVTPVTHSVPTLGCNAIMMLAAGNTAVFNAHPSGARCAAEAVRRFNRAIAERTGLEDLICIVEQPTIESATALFQHPGINMLCATGGTAVARAALTAGKRAVVAGPGNPPVVVDETADIGKAGRGIIAGGAYDNGLLCISEKEIFVVRQAADALLDSLAGQGGQRLTAGELDRLAERALLRDDHGQWIPRREFVGQDPQVLGDVIGVRVQPGVQLLFGVCDESNPLFPCEQMMPVVPISVVRDVDEAIEKAVYFEHGFKHTAMMWSRNVENLTRMGRACATTIFVKNGPCVAGLGAGGQGYASFSISTTGEGVTSPLTFTRYRRCVMVDSLRIF
ncbi:MAG: aldehyde dehydrogenase family protein [Planctomycetota bacterium]